MRDPAIPQRTERLLQSLGADPDFRDAVLGDLAEEFAIRAVWDGERAARWWYRRESVRVAPHLLRNWLGRTPARGLVRIAAAITAGWSSIFALEVVIVQGIAPVFGIPIEGRLLAVTSRTPLEAFALSVLFVVWTHCDGVLAGFVAAKVSPRSPLVGALAFTIVCGAAMVAGNFILPHGSVPLAFRLFNTLALVTGSVVGGLLASLGKNRRSRVASNDSV
ncbi:MAG: hypothetical protein ABI442_17005 [Gemmatimonadaceae bacterium]